MAAPPEDSWEPAPMDDDRDSGDQGAECSSPATRRHPPEVELVVAWYNEDLGWVAGVLDRVGGSRPKIYAKLHRGHGEYPVTVLPNVGRDVHSFLTHICEHYESLAPITIFTPGSVASGAWGDLKRRKLDYVLAHLDEAQSCGVVCQAHTQPGSFLPFDPNFRIKRWASTSDANRRANPTRRLAPARVRPFGAWYRKYISPDTGHIERRGVAFNCILAASAASIRRHPRALYASLLDQASAGADLEVVHYLERVMLSLWAL